MNTNVLNNIAYLMTSWCSG